MRNDFITTKTHQFRQYQQHQLDKAISATFRELASNPAAQDTFHQLLIACRRCSNLLQPIAGQSGRFLGLEALRNLSIFHDEFVHPITDWQGGHASIYELVAGLAVHLLGRYAPPRFLCSVWFGDDTAEGRLYRRWFIEHSRGKRFRDLDLPAPMTRRIQRIFLSSPDHWPLIKAMRWAEIVGSGGTPELADVVLATRLGKTLEHGQFWRTVLHFLIRHSDQLDLYQVNPIIDFLYYIRFAKTEAHTANGITLLDPPEPNFSMKGRTLRSLMRVMNEWHHQLSRGPACAVTWPRSPWREFIFQDTLIDPTSREAIPRRWILTELTNSQELRVEGQKMQHCVAIYTSVCRYGRSAIWSLREHRKDSKGKACAHHRGESVHSHHRSGQGSMQPIGKRQAVSTDDDVGQKRGAGGGYIPVMACFLGGSCRPFALGAKRGQELFEPVQAPPIEDLSPHGVYLDTQDRTGCFNARDDSLSLTPP